MILYNEKLKPILEDLESPEIELAGGSTVGMILSITNSLIIYICNLTIGKKNYEDVQNEVINIKKEAEEIKKIALKVIDEDREVLDKILKTYKTRKNEPEEFENASKNGVIFCKDVMDKAIQTVELTNRIAKVGNRMLASDFEISKKYAISSVEASIVNIEINLKFVKDEEFIEKIRNDYKEKMKKIK